MSVSYPVNRQIWSNLKPILGNSNLVFLLALGGLRIFILSSCIIQNNFVRPLCTQTKHKH